MIKHIIIWDLKDGLSEGEKAECSAKIKNDLEGLLGVVEGLQDVRVYTDLLPSSNGDITLECLLNDEATLAAYAVHPAHVAVKEYIGTVVKGRKCADFEV